VLGETMRFATRFCDTPPPVAHERLSLRAGISKTDGGGTLAFAYADCAAGPVVAGRACGENRTPRDDWVRDSVGPGAHDSYRAFQSPGIRVGAARPAASAKRLDRLCVGIGRSRARQHDLITADLGGVSLEFGVAVEGE
jgi:hypothetical protein